MNTLDTSAHRLLARPIDAAAFAPYGEVLASRGQSGQEINAGTSTRIEMSEPDVLGDQGRPALAVVRAQGAQLPLPVVELERHRLGSQSFIPLAGTPFVVVVALGADAPDLDTLAAFAVDGNYGITYRRDVWHHPLTALADGDFIILDRRGATIDCEMARLPGNWILEAGSRE